MRFRTCLIIEGSNEDSGILIEYILKQICSDLGIKVLGFKKDPAAFEYKLSIEIYEPYALAQLKTYITNNQLTILNA
jgi:hypothetical protein